jgi:transcriptional regulator with XRE-family HTH domain
MTRVDEDSDGDRALGERIRQFRTMRDLSLRALAREANVSPSFLSQLERGQTSASVSMLRRISGSLAMTVAELFDDGDEPGPRVVRKAERPELHAGPGARKFCLSQRPFRYMETYVTEFDSGASTGDDPYTHGDALELVLVLRGRVLLWLAGAEYVLGAGDSIEYRTSLPHRVENKGTQLAEVLWVISPPTPDETPVPMATLQAANTGTTPATQ